MQSESVGGAGGGEEEEEAGEAKAGEGAADDAGGDARGDAGDESGEAAEGAAEEAAAAAYKQATLPWPSRLAGILRHPRQRTGDPKTDRHRQSGVTVNGMP